MKKTNSVFEMGCVNSIDGDNNRSVSFFLYHDGDCLESMSLKDLRLLQIFVGDIIANEELCSAKRKEARNEKGA